MMGSFLKIITADGCVGRGAGGIIPDWYACWRNSQLMKSGTSSQRLRKSGISDAHLNTSLRLVNGT